MTTEDDTYRKLRSLTELEVEEIYTQVYCEISREQDVAGHTNPGDVPIVEIKRRLDSRLAPYGWTFDRYFGVLGLDKYDITSIIFKS